MTTERGGVGREVGEGLKTEGTYLHLWLTHADAWQRPRQHWKATLLQLKTNSFIKKKKKEM